MKAHVARVFDKHMPYPTREGTGYGAHCWGVWPNRAAKDAGQEPITTTYHCACIRVVVRDRKEFL